MAVVHEVLEGPLHSLEFADLLIEVANVLLRDAADVAITRSTVVGGRGDGRLAPGGPGVVAHSARVVVQDSAIHGGAGAENSLTVWMQGGEFRFYANGQYLFAAQDSALEAGYYGFYLFDRTGGGLSVNFDDLVAREVGGAAAGQ